jgi:hypothetical protein
VLAGEILEHLAYPEKLLSECRRILASNGTLLATTPNGENMFSRLPLFADVADRSSLIDSECKPDSEGHLFLFSRKDLSDLITKAGFGSPEFEFYGCSLLSNRLDALITRLPPGVVTVADWMAGRVPFARRIICEGITLTSKKSSD